MSKSNINNGTSPPPLKSDARGSVETKLLADVIAWFLEHDQRVAIIRHPRVEELFQWKQEKSKNSGENVFAFDHAEDRLAIGIIQALQQHASERALHVWISQLLNALEDASKVNEELSGAYHLNSTEDSSIVNEAAKIPAQNARELYLTCCWLETLCTAEVRVLGWIYQELYGKPFAP
jgi:hypothetical protein